MSKTCTPSNPTATGWPSQMVSARPSGFWLGPGVAEAGEFQERTTTFLYTMMSPWFPGHDVYETCVGASGFETSRTLKPSQLAWKARSPQNAMSVWMSGFVPG